MTSTNETNLLNNKGNSSFQDNIIEDKKDISNNININEGKKFNYLIIKNILNKSNI